MNRDYILFYLLWPIAFLSKEPQFYTLLVLLVFLYVLSPKAKLEKDSISFLLVSIGILSLLSALGNATVSIGVPVSRLFAAINTSLVWIFSYLFYSYYRNSSISNEKISRIMMINSSVMLVLCLIPKIFPSLNTWVNSIGYRQLYEADWFLGETKQRFFGLMEYSNLVPIFCFLLFPFVIKFLEKKIGRLGAVLGSFILLGSIIFVSNSRAAIFLFLISSILIIVNVLFVEKRYIFLIACLMISLAGIFLYGSEIFDVVLQLISGRPGSTSTRVHLYLESVRQLDDGAWIFGKGIKTISRMGVPYGSHSTYLGALYKSGLFGFIMTILLVIVASVSCFKEYRSKRTLFTFSFFILSMTLFIFLIIEDFDGSNWPMIYYWSFYGTFFKKSTRESIEREVSVFDISGYERIQRKA